MAQGLIGAFCVRIPLSFAFSMTANPTLFRIGLATPCSTVVQILLCAGPFLWTERRSWTGGLKRA